MSTVAAANLADLPLSTVRGVLAGLARAHLIEAAAGGGGRWRMHDLLRLYAQKLSGDPRPPITGSMAGTGCSPIT